MGIYSLLTKSSFAVLRTGPPGAGAASSLPTPFLFTSSPCSVPFWENDDYKGGTITFDQSKPTGVDSQDDLDRTVGVSIVDLSKYHYSSIPDLEDYKRPDGVNWQNEIVSFILYKEQPNFWSTNTPTLAPLALA